MLDLLTMSLGAFAATVAAAAAAPAAAPPGWVDARHVPLLGRSIFDEYDPELPTFVFFPQAGSSPKQFAPISAELRDRCGFARFLFVQPPGRDSRADEPNVTQLSVWLAAALAALKPYLVGAQAGTGPTVFVGDSWGAIAAYAIAHALCSQHGFTPSHMVVSGSASPAVASTQRGLGSFSSSSMAEISDAELLAFLTKSGATIEESDSSLPSLLRAFRADCELYEEYVKPDGTPPLPTRATVLRGADDKVTSQLEMQGWLQVRL
jgi:surfactin synthase thioesterase subunit